MNKLKKLCNHVKEYGLVKTIKWVYKYIALKINHLSVKNIDFVDVENDSDSKAVGLYKIEIALESEVAEDNFIWDNPPNGIFVGGQN